MAIDYPGLLSLARLHRDRSDAEEEARLLEQEPTDVGALNRLRMQQGFSRGAMAANPQWDAWFEAVRQANPRGENTPFGSRGSSLRKLPTSQSLAALQQVVNQGWGDWRSLEAPWKKLENY